MRGLPSSSFFVACSGGPDSMAVLHFLSQAHKGKTSVIHINHQTPFASRAQALVQDYCQKNNIPFLAQDITASLPKGASKEEFWRNERYKIFHSLPNPVLTGHHLNDVVETWIFSSLHGKGKIIPYQNQNVLRPFLLSKHERLLAYCQKKNVPFILDPSNTDTSFMRNFIRCELLPKALVVNPGIEKVMAKKVEQIYEDLSLPSKNVPGIAHSSRP